MDCSILAHKESFKKVDKEVDSSRGTRKRLPAKGRLLRRTISRLIVIGAYKMGIKTMCPACGREIVWGPEYDMLFSYKGKSYLFCADTGGFKKLTYGEGPKTITRKGVNCHGIAIVEDAATNEPLFISAIVECKCGNEFTNSFFVDQQWRNCRDQAE